MQNQSKGGKILNCSDSFHVFFLLASITKETFFLTPDETKNKRVFNQVRAALSLDWRPPYRSYLPITQLNYKTQTRGLCNRKSAVE